MRSSEIDRGLGGGGMKIRRMKATKKFSDHGKLHDKTVKAVILIAVMDTVCPSSNFVPLKAPNIAQ